MLYPFHGLVYSVLTIGLLRLYFGYPIFYKWGNRSSERLNSLSDIAEEKNNKNKIETHRSLCL